jgi:hypothetical protein
LHKNDAALATSQSKKFDTAPVPVAFGSGCGGFTSYPDPDLTIISSRILHKKRDERTYHFLVIYYFQEN